MDCNRGSSSGFNKSRIREEIRWDNLPSLVITNIFTMLDEYDRENASEVCKNWRREYFQPRFWPDIKFTIDEDNLEKIRFLTNLFGSNVKDANVNMDSFSKACIEELSELMQKLAENKNLKTLSINPTRCNLDTSKNQARIRWETVDWKKMSEQFEVCLPRLTELSIGCLGMLPFNVNWILQQLNPKSLKILRLASCSRNPPLFNNNYFNPRLLEPFVSLEVLSINYGQLSDEVLKELRNAVNLKTLIVHLNGFCKNHKGTTDEAWKTFKKNHPGIKMNLILVHVFEQGSFLQRNVLRKQMPLMQLKIYCCYQLEHICVCRITS